MNFNLVVLPHEPKRKSKFNFGYSDERCVAERGSVKIFLPGKMSLPKAVFLVSNAPILPPGMVNAGADKSRDWPSVSKN